MRGCPSKHGLPKKEKGKSYAKQEYSRKEPERDKYREEWEIASDDDLQSGKFEIG